ncbi:unnamed protein product [Paramecium primaurelia]|uniref:Uncharacterized protein n=1 Tax=Paramecium primaurelia TaxID=5886 RepID=A0A8S1QQ22_PARPR|nr:unnamed protein product [Paramecium primaurelia]
MPNIEKGYSYNSIGNLEISIIESTLTSDLMDQQSLKLQFKLQFLLFHEGQYI